VIIPFFTASQSAALAPSPAVLDVLDHWLGQGRGVAIFQVTDLGHADGDQYRFVSYITWPCASLGVEH
jgi:hypothetical protein